MGEWVSECMSIRISVSNRHHPQRCLHKVANMCMLHSRSRGGRAECERLRRQTWYRWRWRWQNQEQEQKRVGRIVPSVVFWIIVVQVNLNQSLPIRVIWIHCTVIGIKKLTNHYAYIQWRYAYLHVLPVRCTLGTKHLKTACYMMYDDNWLFDLTFWFWQYTYPTRR